KNRVQSSQSCKSGNLLEVCELREVHSVASTLPAQVFSCRAAGPRRTRRAAGRGLFAVLARRVAILPDPGQVRAGVASITMGRLPIAWPNRGTGSPPESRRATTAASELTGPFDS